MNEDYDVECTTFVRHIIRQRCTKDESKQISLRLSWLITLWNCANAGRDLARERPQEQKSLGRCEER